MKSKSFKLNNVLNKRGDEQLEWAMINLFFIGLIFLISFTAINKLEDNSIHEEVAKTRDLAFTYDVASISNNNINLVYNLPNNLNAEISSQCKVNLLDQKKNVPSQYFCNQKQRDLNLIKKDNLFILERKSFEVTE